MSARSIRRAAERKAKKLARRGESAPVGQVINLQADSQSAISEARLAANRANAQLSTGPKSDDGKAKSSLNAIKTGLTGRTVLLPSDDAARYEQHVHEFFNEFQPSGLREAELVQSIADTAWRLSRIPGLEMAIYADPVRRPFLGARRCA